MVFLVLAVCLSSAELVLAQGSIFAQDSVIAQDSADKVQTGPAKIGAGAVVTAADVHLDGKQTRLVVRMSKGVTAEVFTLSNPYRVIVDLPDIDFALSPDANKSARGLVTAFRFGLFAERKGRIVLDTSGPVAVTSAAMTEQTPGGEIFLTVDIASIDAASFGEGTGAARQAESKARSAAEPPKPAEPRAAHNAKPVIMIDPGHGGIDPGATGGRNIAEKMVVLAVGRQLKTMLMKTGRYDVRMTRQTDVFVPLDRRVQMSAEQNASLFISLHADSISERDSATDIRGATVYTLSKQASDFRARRLAEKENASDALAGLKLETGEDQDDVRNILFDLMARETANFSVEFSNALVKRLSKIIPLSRDPQRSAAFKVLKQTHAPSVLVELGYLSNQDDEAKLITDQWQREVATAITKAVDAYFDKRTASQ